MDRRAISLRRVCAHSHPETLEFAYLHFFYALTTMNTWNHCPFEFELVCQGTFESQLIFFSRQKKITKNEETKLQKRSVRTLSLCDFVRAVDYNLQFYHRNRWKIGWFRYSFFCSSRNKYTTWSLHFALDFFLFTLGPLVIIYGLHI